MPMLAMSDDGSRFEVLYRVVYPVLEHHPRDMTFLKIESESQFHYVKVVGIWEG